MLKFSKISPLARAVGTMGAVAVLAGATTFALLTSNTVAVGPNNLTVAGAQLSIGDGNCAGLNTTSTPGFTSNNFSTSNPASVNFCLANSGSVPLVLTASVSATDPGALNGSPAAQDTTLTVTCTGDQPVSGTLNTSWTTTFPTTLASNAQRVCSATATLSASHNGSGSEVIPTFNINFVGTEPAPQT